MAKIGANISFPPPQQQQQPLSGAGLPGGENGAARGGGAGSATQRPPPPPSAVWQPRPPRARGGTGEELAADGILLSAASGPFPSAAAGFLPSLLRRLFLPAAAAPLSRLLARPPRAGAAWRLREDLGASLGVKDRRGFGERRLVPPGAWIYAGVWGPASVR